MTVTTHITTIVHKSSYKVSTTGTMPVWDEDGKSIARIIFTYYERTDVKIVLSTSDFVEFGGPGLRLRMHIAYTGPKLLNIDDEGYPVHQSYGIKENPISRCVRYCLLESSKHSYSRATSKDIPKKILWCQCGYKYPANWIGGFVTDLIVSQNTLLRKLWNDTCFWTCTSYKTVSGCI
jgi:hypothetical protein